MKTYEQFHGFLEAKEVGKELRKIVKEEKDDFKILTGYGSTCGLSKSKVAALKSLKKMKSEGLIKAYLPGEIKYKLIDCNSQYYFDKLKYVKVIKDDKDFGNEGIVYVFIK